MQYIKAYKQFKQNSFIIGTIVEKYDFHWFDGLFESYIEQRELLSVMRLFCYIVDWIKNTTYRSLN